MNVDLQDHIRASKTNGYSEKEDLISQLLSIHDFTRNKEMDDYWQIMTDEQIYKASLSNNITIGSHGFFHNNLGSLSNDDAVNEVAQSKKYLEEIIQKEVSSIGFPDGSYTPQLNDALYKKGFTEQFVVNYRFNDDSARDFTHDRFGLYPYMGNHNSILHKIVNS